MKLTNLKIGTKVKIIRLDIKDYKLRLRLQELGLYAGNVVTIINISPLKETFLVQIFNTCFAIKKNIASNIYVEYFY